MPADAPGASGDAAAAGGGRRAFLRGAAAAGAGLLAGASGCGWNGGQFWNVLRAWETPNRVLQEALFRPGQLARTYPAGRETERIPQYFISPTVPRADVATWRLRVGGAVASPLAFTLDDLMQLPRTTLRVRHYCIEGWTAVASWTGVRVRDLARVVRPGQDARYIEFRSFDSGYWSSWDRESAFHPQTLIAYGMNGALLSPGHGAPARLYGNVKYGYKSVKYLTEVNFLPRRTGGYWEDRGYDWFAGL